MLTLSPATQEAAERREVGEPPAGVCQGLDPASEPGPLTTWGLRAALGLEDGGEATCLPRPQKAGPRFAPALGPPLCSSFSLPPFPAPLHL